MAIRGKVELSAVTRLDITAICGTKAPELAAILALANAVPEVECVVSRGGETTQGIIVMALPGKDDPSLWAADLTRSPVVTVLVIFVYYHRLERRKT